MRRFIQFILIIALVFSIFTVTASAAIVSDELSTLSENSIEFVNDSSLNGYFYKSELGNNNLTSYTYDYFANQTVTITQELDLVFTLGGFYDFYDSEIMFLTQYLENNLSFLGYNGEVDVTLSFPQHITFTSLNPKAKYTQSFDNLNGEISFIQAYVVLTYDTKMGISTKYDWIMDTNLPLSSHVDNFYLQPYLPTDVWSDPEMSVYIKPITTTVDFISPTAAMPGITFASWFSTSLHKCFYEYSYYRLNKSTSFSLTNYSYINNEIFRAKGYNTVLTNWNDHAVPLIKLASSDYTVAQQSILLDTPFEAYFHYFCGRDADTLVNSSYCYNSVPYSFNFIYTILDNSLIAASPYPGSTSFDIDSLYIDPANILDIPAYLNNFIVWLVYQSPGVSYITKPIVQVVGVAGDIYGTYVVGFISSLGLIGVFILFRFFYTFLSRIFGGS